MDLATLRLDGFTSLGTEDGLRLPVRWGEEQGLAGVRATRIALRFWFYGGARLYSFAFESL